MEVLHEFDRQRHAATPLAPYAHSSPPALLRGAGECAEWFVFAVDRASCGDQELDDAWLTLAGEESGWNRVGTRIALANIRRGLRPPQSGHDNPHYFDDLAMVRAAAYAVAVADPEGAREIAAADAHVTHDLDGVWCADSMVVLIQQLRAGAAASQAVRAAADALPEGSWSRRLTESALEIASSSRGSVELAHRLTSELCDGIYSYPVAAPETLAVLLAQTVRATSAEELLLGTTASGRNGTVLAALAGVVATVRFGDAWIPRDISADTVLDGIAIPRLAGVTAGDVLRRA